MRGLVRKKSEMFLVDQIDKSQFGCKCKVLLKIFIVYLNKGYDEVNVHLLNLKV